MAGYFIDGCHLDRSVGDQFVHGFHIGHPDFIGYVKERTQSRVLTLQVDGDELNAALLGLAKFDKERDTPELLRLFEVARLNAMAGRPPSPMYPHS